VTQLQDLPGDLPLNVLDSLPGCGVPQVDTNGIDPLIHAKAHGAERYWE